MANETLEWLRGEWRTLADKVDASLAEQAEFRGRFDGMQQNVQEVRTEVYGNGKPGLKAEVDRMKNARSMMVWVAGAAIALASAALGGLAQGWTHRP